jgi:hypothetical protein
LALAVVLAAGAVLAGPSPARATFTLTLHETGFTDAVYGDNGAGVIFISGGSFGDFAFQADIATSNSQSGVAPATLTINQLAFRNQAQGSKSLTITIQDDGFTAPSPGQVIMTTQLATISLTNAGDTVSERSYLNGVGGTLLSLGTAPSGDKVQDVVQETSSPYTLTNVTTLNLSKGGMIASVGSTTVATPAPAGALLALTGVPFLGLGLLRRRKAAQPACE